MTSLTDTQVITASGGLVELGYVQRTSNYVIASTTVSGAADVFASDLTVVSDGSPFLIEFTCGRAITASGGPYIDTYLVDGSGTSIALMNLLFPGGTQAPAYCQMRTQEPPGTYTYNVRTIYNTPGVASLAGGTGTGGAQSPIMLRASKIVQATQWPAVTTGTIICTSSTRPASPFEGQQIFETDTKKRLTYNGSSWYSDGLQFEATSTSSAAVTSLADISGMTTGSSFTAVSGRRYKATYVCAQASGTLNERMAVQILAGASSVQKVYMNLQTPGGVPVMMAGTFTASGVTTVKVRAERDVGTNTSTLYADGTSPMKLWVEDIGPA